MDVKGKTAVVTGGASGIGRGDQQVPRRRRDERGRGWGPIHGVHVFLPIMEAHGEGHTNSTEISGSDGSHWRYYVRHGNVRHREVP